MPKGTHNNHPKMEDHGRWKGGMRINNGYMYVRTHGHPRSRKSGYVKRAVLILEKKLGRFLNPKEDAHHIDENKLNDSPSNLEAIDHGLHASLHGKKHPKKFELRVCVICSTPIYRTPSKYQRPPELTTCSIRCRNILNGRHASQRHKKKDL